MRARCKVCSADGRCAELCLFFFSSRRRHTRCLSDWSSDVCSSDLMGQLRQELDLAGGEKKILVLAGDGSFCNRTCFRAPRDRTELISRTRKDAVLCGGSTEGGRRFYGTQKFTPEQVRQDETRSWKQTKIFYGGK